MKHKKDPVKFVVNKDRSITIPDLKFARPNKDTGKGEGFTVTSFGRLDQMTPDQARKFNPLGDA
jgi:hypothetical protein